MPSDFTRALILFLQDASAPLVMRFTSLVNLIGPSFIRSLPDRLTLSHTIWVCTSEKMHFYVVRGREWMRDATPSENKNGLSFLRT